MCVCERERKIGGDGLRETARDERQKKVREGKSAFEKKEEE